MIYYTDLRRMPDEERNRRIKFIAEHKSHMSVREMADKLDMNYYTLQKFMNDNSISTEKKHICNPPQDCFSCKLKDCHRGVGNVTKLETEWIREALSYTTTAIKKPVPDGWLTTKQFGAKFRKSYTSIVNFINLGVIYAEMINNQYYIPPEEIGYFEDYIHRRRRKKYEQSC